MYDSLRTYYPCSCFKGLILGGMGNGTVTYLFHKDTSFVNVLLPLTRMESSLYAKLLIGVSVGLTA